MATRRSENAKAYGFRKILKDGGKLKPEQKSWLDDYEATKRKPGRPPGVKQSNNLTDDDMPEPVNLDSEPGDVDDIPPPPPPPPPPPAADIPRPPYIATEARETGKGDWRDKYRKAERGGIGREQTCLLIAGKWLDGLLWMERRIKEAGLQPIIDPQELAGAIVLTVDEVLPDQLEISPRVLAVGGSSALVIQQFLQRDKIATAQKAKQERAKYEQWKTRRQDPPPWPEAVPTEPKPEQKAEEQKPEERKPEHTQSESQQSDAVTKAATRAVIAANAKKDPIDPSAAF